MKKMTYFVMALALVLGFTQCKKEQTPANNETEGVFITLDVNGGNNGSRVIVDPTGNNGEFNYATVTFEDGDVIYVGNAGAYCGYLTFNGTNFTGTVNPTSTADYLHFYFMGNKGPADSAPTEAVSITDQTVKYPVISYAHSTDLYSSTQQSYTAKLKNYCSIVKFTTNSIPTATAVTVKGMKNTVAVNFGANNAATSTSGSPYTFTKSGDGDITLHAVSTSERWAILLEQSKVDGATVTASGYNNGTCNVPEITNNMYCTTGVDITLAPAADYVFSVSSTQTVHFSPGNLQYKYDEGWRFAEHQYDYIDVWYDDEWVDLFGWGMWTGSTPNPLQTSDTYSVYTWDNDDFTQEDLLADASQRGYDWRTLTKDEWQYILNNSTYGMATVNGVHGIVILPDESTLSISDDHDAWNNNVYTASDWTNNMEAYGAVFLPAAGIRGGTAVTDCEDYGHYWSSTLSSNNKRAWYMYFPDDEEFEAVVDTDGIKVGCSVRLVR